MEKAKLKQILTKYQIKVINNKKSDYEYYDADFPVWASALIEAVGDLTEQVEELKGLMGVEEKK